MLWLPRHQLNYCGTENLCPSTRHWNDWHLCYNCYIWLLQCPGLTLLSNTTTATAIHLFILPAPGSTFRPTWCRRNLTRRKQRTKKHDHEGVHTFYCCFLVFNATKGSWWAIDWHILIAPRSWWYMELSSRPPRWHPPSLIQPLFIIVYCTCVHWWPGWQLYPGFVWAAVFSKNLLNKVQIEIKTLHQLCVYVN